MQKKYVYNLNERIQEKIYYITRDSTLYYRNIKVNRSSSRQSKI